MLVAAVSQQRVGESAAVLSPGLIDLQDHSSQTSRPLLQELLTHCFEIVHHQVQDATVTDVTEEEVVHILLFCREKRQFIHQQPAEFCRTSHCHSYHIPCILQSWQAESCCGEAADRLCHHTASPNYSDFHHRYRDQTSSASKSKPVDKSHKQTTQQMYKNFLTSVYLQYCSSLPGGEVFIKQFLKINLLLFLAFCVSNPSRASLGCFPDIFHHSFPLWCFLSFISERHIHGCRCEHASARAVS